MRKGGHEQSAAAQTLSAFLNPSVSPTHRHSLTPFPLLTEILARHAVRVNAWKR